MVFEYVGIYRRAMMSAMNVMYLSPRMIFYRCSLKMSFRETGIGNIIGEFPEGVIRGDHEKLEEDSEKRREMKLWQMWVRIIG